ncbi:uncharacterized protein F5891DRAFT_1191475 [Suillus fuscotomentosus]|uniref:Uncharacterized protein n=1 Tax=Suillus fuscotomentosus TaxID=1912939 RepID=A0AAD4HIX4_9AGAM|nr:uncharacterized protein F5891DRAFT_1191475 [Suillus fuscotomentosus]KAG1897851.1 hypothetical protein F5891DRAFT_1191475 [Suillus fuscotomentosus]
MSSSSDRSIFGICTTFNFDPSTSTRICIIRLPLAFFKAAMILHRLFAVTDLLGDQYSVVHRCVLPALCTKQGHDDETDTSEIMFYNDPEDDVPLPLVPSNGPDDNTGHMPATVTAGSWRSGHPSKPSACIRDADNVASSSGTRKRAHTSSNTADEDLPSAAPDPGESSSDELIPQLDDDDDEAESNCESNCLKKRSYSRHLDYIHSYP